MAADPLRVYKALGFFPQYESGDHTIGDCPFCGKANKLYVNTLTGQWDCKSAACGSAGNIYTYIRKWYVVQRRVRKAFPWAQLAKSRGIPSRILKRERLAFDGLHWYIPVRNRDGRVVNLRAVKPLARIKIKGLPSIPVSLYGLERLGRKTSVYLCEGEWDAMCMQDMLDRAGVDAVALGVPGANTFKDTWLQMFLNRDVTICYDNDPDGERGAFRAGMKLDGIASSIRVVTWPPESPSKYDVRDFYVQGGSHDVLQELCHEFDSNLHEKHVAQAPQTDYPPLSSGTRLPFASVMALFRKWLAMDKSMQTALRIIFASVYTVQLEGDPLWIHIAAPPGTGKTELLISLAHCPECELVSSLTPASLVSGFNLGGKDPSLIPQLNRRVLVIKDYTEILSLNRDSRENVLSTLRGAYDGRVHRVFGNGVIRDYAVEFNLLSGVTQALFASSDSILGERFLTYHLVKGVAGDFDDAVKTAIRNVGVESRMRREIAETVAQFLRFSVTSKDLPEIPLPVTDEISALAQMASILRGTVDRDHYRDVLHYRPQHETGTRLAKQLARLLLGLALLHDPPKITALDRQILRRVAFDSCVGFKLELFLEVGREGGLTIAELSSRTGIPSQTARSHVEDLFLLGAFRKELLSPSMRGGSRPSAYYLTDRAVSLWHKSGARRVEVESPEHRQARRQFTRYGRRRGERRQTAFDEINSPLK